MRQFAETAKDAELIAEAEKLKLDMSYHTPAQLERLVGNLYETPPAMIDTIKRLVPNMQ